MKPTTEIWKPIPAFVGLYEASSSGRIRSLDRITAHGTTRKGRVLKGHRHPDGHLTLSLWRDGNRNRRYVHRLVLSAIAGEPKPGQEDFEEIGFGISGQWSSPEQCAHMVVSDIQNYGWETEGNMPDPQAIKVEVEATS